MSSEAAALSYSVVIVRYKESLSWLDNWTPDNIKFKVYVYNKNPDPTNTGLTDATIENFGDSLDVINLGNVGRYCTTYLYHILSNPDAISGSNYTIFMNGNPFRHFTTTTTAETFQTELEERIAAAAPTTAESLFADLHVEEWDRFPGMNLLKHYYDFISSPDSPAESSTYGFSRRCQYIVPKSIIQARSTDIYKFTANALINGKEIVIEDLWNPQTYEYNKCDLWCIERIFYFLWNLDYIVNSEAEVAGAALDDANILTALSVV